MVEFYQAEGGVRFFEAPFGIVDGVGEVDGFETEKGGHGFFR